MSPSNMACRSVWKLTLRKWKVFSNPCPNVPNYRRKSTNNWSLNSIQNKQLQVKDMPSTFNELLKPRRVDVETINATRSIINIEPLNRGFGHTLGNALRRVLLSAMSGCAVTEVEIEGVLHEYTTVEGVEEDVTDIMLNLKGLAIKMHTNDEAHISLKKTGPGPVLASDITVDHDMEICNPDHLIANLTKAGELNMTMKVERGRGYRPVVIGGYEEETQAI